jgi:hypothetical protein
MNSTQPLNNPTDTLPAEVTLVNGMADSAFIKKLREAFLSPATSLSLWNNEFADPTASNRTDLIAADIAGAFRSVFLRNENSALKPAPEPGAANSATKLMEELLLDAAKEWPDDLTKFPVPAPYKVAAFRRYEIACAVSVMMHAFNKGGPGGDPANFPPTRPA